MVPGAGALAKQRLFAPTGGCDLLRLGPGPCAGPCGHCSEGGGRGDLHYRGQFCRGPMRGEPVCSRKSFDFGVRGILTIIFSKIIGSGKDHTLRQGGGGATLRWTGGRSKVIIKMFLNKNSVIVELYQKG